MKNNKKKDIKFIWVLENNFNFYFKNLHIIIKFSIKFKKIKEKIKEFKNFKNNKNKKL